MTSPERSKPVNPFYAVVERSPTLRALLYRWECLDPFYVKLVGRMRRPVSLLRHRFPAYTAHERDRPPLFFVIGAPRSGNTLLRALLCQHPRIVMPPESYFLPKVCKLFAEYGHLPWQTLVARLLDAVLLPEVVRTWQFDEEALRREILGIPEPNQTLVSFIAAIYRRYALQHKPEADVWGDKTPNNTLNLPWLHAAFPNARFVHIIRDGRDAVASALQSDIMPSVEVAMGVWQRCVRAGTAFGLWV